jgi:hypothetical protein
MLIDFDVLVLNNAGEVRRPKDAAETQAEEGRKEVERCRMCADINAPAKYSRGKPPKEIGSADIIHYCEQYTPSEHLSPLKRNDEMLSFHGRPRNSN